LEAQHGRKMPVVQHLVIAALLATLAACLASILLLGRLVGDRSPVLFRALTANLVLFGLLTAVGLGYRLVEAWPPTGSGPAGALHALAAQILALTVLKIAWLRSLASVAFALRQRPVAPRLDRAAAIAAVSFGLLATAGWAHVARTGQLSIVVAVALVSDAFALVVVVAISTWLWRESSSASGIAGRRAMRWFSAGNVAVVACVALSFAASAIWPAWSGSLQALAHSLALLAYEALLVAWAVRWAGAWAEEGQGSAGGGSAFDLAVERCGLSKREREVAARLCQGRTNQEIADDLFVALQTVKDHNYRIFQKAGVRNRTELARRLMSPERR